MTNTQVYTQNYTQVVMMGPLVQVIQKEMCLHIFVKSQRSPFHSLWQKAVIAFQRFKQCRLCVVALAPPTLPNCAPIVIFPETVTTDPVRGFFFISGPQAQSPLCYLILQ